MKKLSIFLLLLFFLSPIFAGSEKLVLAINSLSDGFYDYAIKYCNEYLQEENANIPYGKMILGLSYYRKKNYQSAIVNFKDIVFEHNNFSKIHKVKLYLALSYLENKEGKKGLELLEKLKSSKIKDRAYFYQGFYYKNKKDNEKARENLSYVVKNTLDSSLWDRANFELADLYKDIKRYDLLEETILSYLERSPKGKYANRLRFTLGLNYYYMGSYNKAIEDFKILIDKTYKIGDSYFYLGDSHYFNGDFNNAILNYKKAISFKTQFINTSYENIILSYITLENYHGALNTIKEIIENNVKIDPLKIKYYYLKIYYRMKKYDEAKLYLEPLLKQTKSNTILREISLIKGNILYDEKKYTDAVAFLKKENLALKSNAIDELIGDIYSLNELSNALSFYNKIISSTADITIKDRVYLKMAKVDLKYLKLPDGLDMLNKISQNAQNDEYYFNLGKVLYHMDEYEKAHKALMKVLEGSKYFIEAGHYIAWVLQKTGHINDY